MPGKLLAVLLFLLLVPGFAGEAVAQSGYLRCPRCGRPHIRPPVRVIYPPGRCAPIRGVPGSVVRARRPVFAGEAVVPLPDRDAKRLADEDRDSAVVFPGSAGVKRVAGDCEGVRMPRRPVVLQAGYPAYVPGPYYYMYWHIGPVVPVRPAVPARPAAPVFSGRRSVIVRDRWIGPFGLGGREVIWEYGDVSSRPGR